MKNPQTQSINESDFSSKGKLNTKLCSWNERFINHLMLFILFLTEGLAVGVGFGAIGKTASATFENARYYI